tara:strand:- start:208 stop:681 length:474 start_codon:yes stop_codon:yes gene_type:complete
VPCRNGRIFTPAWQRFDVEGDAKQRQLRHLGTHQRAPFGVDDTRELEGKIYYKSVAASGPGAWYAKQVKEERREKMDIVFDAALKYGRAQVVEQRASSHTSDAQAAYGRAQVAEQHASAQTSAAQASAAQRAAADYALGGSVASQIAHRRLGRASGS